MKVVVAALLLLEALISFGFGVSLPLTTSTESTTAPAFLWAPHHNQFLNNVNYQTISPKDLAKSVLSEGEWSNLLCSGSKLQPPVDLTLVFVGRELHSSDVSGSRRGNPTLVDFLKVSFMTSNFSVAFPYVATSEEETMENSLFSGFTEACGRDLCNVAFSDSCSIEGKNFQKLADLRSVHDHLVSRRDKPRNGQANLVVFCCGGSHSFNELDQPRLEGDIISELVSSVDKSGAKYAVLYVSRPLKTIQYPFSRDLERFLAEGAVGKGSANSTSCNEVCQIKSSLLEGFLVAIVLLLILVSGLCCMMGIDTPTRFETPQDS
ncbi:hypothetical protein CFOL_v3_06653 [Cephalotus follicularis]|uniref:V-type proton ATPase subunit S1/VOA1 transmembrane domain-containing protein n=1 Tax=Cephalotus follicularis TaxID=3775 RepID=A0A1Q3B5R9_CEPFO|nr:hypothetical protein CFOL_v3_06653 [Cephalotus follicularis]